MVVAVAVASEYFTFSNARLWAKRLSVLHPLHRNIHPLYNEKDRKYKTLDRGERVRRQQALVVKLAQRPILLPKSGKVGSTEACSIGGMIPVIWDGSMSALEKD